MGKRTSIYLSDELADRVKASGLTPAQLIERGLDHADDIAPAAAAPELADLARRVAAIERQLAPRDDHHGTESGARRWLDRLLSATTAAIVTTGEAGELTGISSSRAHSWLTRAESEGWITRLPALPRRDQGPGRNPIRWQIRAEGDQPR